MFTLELQGDFPVFATEVIGLVFTLCFFLLTFCSCVSSSVSTTYLFLKSTSDSTLSPCDALLLFWFVVFFELPLCSYGNVFSGLVFACFVLTEYIILVENLLRLLCPGPGNQLHSVSAVTCDSVQTNALS